MPRKIATSLWFDDDALEAAEYYASVIDDCRITNVMTDPGGNPHTTEGQVLVVDLQIGDQNIQILNGGPHFVLDEAASVVLECDSQEEADRYYTELTREGSEAPCGWCKDKFGLSWQIVPPGVNDLFALEDKAAARRAVEAMLSMTRLDAEAMRRAAFGA